MNDIDKQTNQDSSSNENLGSVNFGFAIGVPVMAILVVGLIFGFHYKSKKDLCMDVVQRTATELQQIIEAPDLASLPQAIENVLVSAEDFGADYSIKMGLYGTGNSIFTLSPQVRTSWSDGTEKSTLIAVYPPNDGGERAHWDSGGNLSYQGNNLSKGNSEFPEQWIGNDVSVDPPPGPPQPLTYSYMLQYAWAYYPTEVHAYGTYRFPILGLKQNVSCQAYAYLNVRSPGLPPPPAPPPGTSPPPGSGATPTPTPNPSSSPSPSPLPAVSPTPIPFPVTDCGDSFDGKGLDIRSCGPTRITGAVYRTSGAPDANCGCCECLSEEDAKTQSRYNNTEYVWRGDCRRCFAPVTKPNPTTPWFNPTPTPQTQGTPGPTPTAEPSPVPTACTGSCGAGTLTCAKDCTCVTLPTITGSCPPPDTAFSLDADCNVQFDPNWRDAMCIPPQTWSDAVCACVGASACVATAAASIDCSGSFDPAADCVALGGIYTGGVPDCQCAGGTSVGIGGDCAPTGSPCVPLDGVSITCQTWSDCTTGNFDVVTGRCDCGGPVNALDPSSCAPAQASCNLYVGGGDLIDGCGGDCGPNGVSAGGASCRCTYGAFERVDGTFGCMGSQQATCVMIDSTHYSCSDATQNTGGGVNVGSNAGMTTYQCQGGTTVVNSDGFGARCF